MKKLILLVVFATTMTNVFGVSGTFYWVGASGGTWATTSNWSSTTNGVYTAVGAAPTTSDIVYFDGIKSTGTVVSPASTTYTDMSVVLGAATTIASMTVSSGGTITFTANYTLIMSTSLTFSNSSKLSATPSSNGTGFTLGTGTGFTLSGMSTSNYFDGNTNTYFTFNTTSPLTVCFNPAASTAYGALVPTKGLITLGTSVSTTRVTFGANGSNLTQGLALNGNTLTISGGNSHTFNQQSNCSAIDASVAGSKVIITASAPSLLYQGGNIFKPGATIDYLEFNSSGNIFTLFNPITVNTLKLTAGSINNTYNNITVNTAILKGGANNGNLLTAPVYGGTVAVTTSASSTSGNELLGTSGKVGTLAVNDGVTYTLSGNGVTSYSLTNCGLGYATAPSITFNTPTNGTVATGTAVVQGGVVVGINITNPGVGYTAGSTPTVTIPNAPASFSAWSNKSYVVGDLVTNSNNLYACVSAGTSTTAPTGTTQSQTPAGGTSKWSYLCGTWTASIAYSVGVTCINNSNLYLCISTNGNSAASGGPSGTGSSITDGSILWKYLGSCSGLSPANAAATVTYNSNNSLTVDNLTIGTGTSGIVNYPNNPNALTLNVNNNVSVSAGAKLEPVAQTSSVTHLLKVGGNLTGTFTTSVTNGKLDVTMNGTGSQSINSAITFNGLTISNTTATVSSTAALNTTNLTINSGAVLNMQANALSTVTTPSGTGKLQTQATTAAIPSGKTWTFNVEYNNLTGGQTVITGIYSGGLTMSNTSGVNTAGGNLTIGNSLTLNTGSNLLLPSGNSIYSVTGFTGSTGAGTLQIGDINTTYRIPTGLTWGGTVQYVFAGNNRIVPGYYNNLTIDDGTARTINWGNASGETGTIAIAGTLTSSSTSFVVNQATVEFNGTNQAIPRITVYNLKLSGTGTTFPNNFIYIANNFDPGSIASASQGNIIFNGTTGSQAIPAFGYYNLNISNSSGITMNNDVTVNKSLTLTSGNISTGANTLTIGSTGSIGGSASSYINGNLAMVYGATGSKTFPVGAGGNYRPVTINATALDVTPSTFTVYQTESAFSGTLPAHTSSTLARNWTIAQSGSTAYTYSLTLDGTGFTPTGSAKILQNNAGTVSSHNTTGTYTSSGLTNTGSFGLGDYVAPPVITASTTALSSFGYTYNAGPSTSKNFTVSGTNMVAGITVTPTTNYEVSADNSTFSGSAIVIGAAGTISSTTVYVRLKSGLSAEDYNAEAVTLTSTSATEKDVTCSGTVSKATPTLSLQTSSVNYSGSSQSATVNSSVAGTVSNVLYAGSATAPTAVNSYAVTADFLPTDATNYATLTGASAGTYTISAVAPGAPTIGTATAGNAQVSVAFTAPSNDGGSTILDYTVTPYISGIAQTAATGVTSSPYSFTGLTNGTAYTFTVTARNSVGSSSASDASNSATPASPSVNVVADANLSTYSPTSATDVTVTSGELTVDADASVKSMTVAPGAKLTLASGKTLTVVGAFTLHSDVTGTATFVDNGGTISAGSSNVEQYLTSGRNWYISSPVTGAKSDVLSASELHPVYLYDEVHGTSAPWPIITNTTTDLNVMQGYVTNPATTGVVTFSGSLNTGSKSIDVTRTAGQTKAGFNLVGNPYPSYLNWDNATKTDLLTSIWYRTKTSGDVYTFDTYNSTGGVSTSNGVKAVTNLIPPMQAFWVRVDKSLGAITGTFAVNNTMRSHADNSSNGFKSKSSTESTQPLLRLEVSNGLTSDQALVYFNASASNSFDNYDSPKMSNNIANIPEIYTLAGNEQVVINGVNNLTQLTLGFTTGQSGNFTIKASQFANFVSGTQIVLKDNVLNVEQDLTVADYNFYSEITNNNESRFTLLFKAPSVATGLNQNATSNVWISLNGNNQIVVNGANAESTVAVYNSVGQKLVSERITASTKALSTQFVPGVYMLTISNSGKTVTKKLIID